MPPLGSGRAHTYTRAVRSWEYFLIRKKKKKICVNEPPKMSIFDHICAEFWVWRRQFAKSMQKFFSSQPLGFNEIANHFNPKKLKKRTDPKTTQQFCEFNASHLTRVLLHMVDAAHAFVCALLSIEHWTWANICASIFQINHRKQQTNPNSEDRTRFMFLF